MRPGWAGRSIEVVLLLLGGGAAELEPVLEPMLHLSADAPPLVRRRISLHG